MKSHILTEVFDSRAAEFDDVASGYAVVGTHSALAHLRLRIYRYDVDAGAVAIELDLTVDQCAHV